MKHKLGVIEIPNIDELLEKLDPATVSPQLAKAERELTKVETECDRGRRELAELSALLSNLPDAIIQGRAPQSSLQEAIDGERAAALLLKSREAEVEAAREAVEAARTAARGLVVDEANKLLTNLREMIKSIIPLLEASVDLEYQIEDCLIRAHRNPAGVPHAREPSPSVTWPMCLQDNELAKAGRSVSLDSGLPGGFDPLKHGRFARCE